MEGVRPSGQLWKVCGPWGNCGRCAALEATEEGVRPSRQLRKVCGPRGNCGRCAALEATVEGVRPLGKLLKVCGPRGNWTGVDPVCEGSSETSIHYIQNNKIN